MTGTHRRFVSTLMPAGREVPKPRARSSGGSGPDVLAAPRSAHIRTHLTTSKRLPTCILSRPCASGSLAYRAPEFSVHLNTADTEANTLHFPH